MTTYDEFLQGKIPMAQLDGFEPQSEPHPSLRPDQRDIARWACRGGRRAVFAAFGLGKTRIHLQVAKWITELEPSKKYLIIAPLGVRQEFAKVEGPAMGMTVQYCCSNEEVAACESQIIITNYERVRDGQITVTPEVFSGAGLDEASCLRSYGSKTYQSFLKLFRAIRFRFVFTATPSPNRQKELIHYGGFLGVMDTGEALTRFFQRDSEKAGNLTLYPHMEGQFWQWLSSWAVFIQRPSDLDDKYSDAGFDLPPMEVHWHKVEVDHKKAWKMCDSWGQHQLFLDQSSGLRELSEIKRDTLMARLAKAQEIIAEAPERHWLLWHDLEAERHLIEKFLPQFKTVYGTQDLETREEIVLGFSRGEVKDLASKPILTGSGCNFQRHCADAIFFGVGYKLNDFLQAVHRVYRFQQSRQVNIHIIFSESETPVVAVLKKKWAEHNSLVARMTGIIRENGLSITDMKLKKTLGCQRLEVEGERFRAINNDCILELMKYDEEGNQTALQEEAPPATAERRGAVPSEESQGNSEIRPSMVSETCQKSHSEEGSMGQGESTEEASLLEADEAKRQVCDLRNEDDKPTLRSLPQDGPRQGIAMPILQSRTRIFQGQPEKSKAGNSIPHRSSWPDNSVDLICTSIPFGTQYEYSPSVNDLGHNPSNAAFFEQMEFLVPNLLRVLKPGRVCCLHVKDRIRFGNVTGLGMATVDRFSDKTAGLFEKYGFQFFGRITIDTDVVRENNQTYRLGWTENSKDSTKMGVGMNEYVLLLRKLPSDLFNAYADEPVTKDKAAYTRSDWQIDAAGLWRSDGDRLPDPEILANISHEQIGQVWKAHCAKFGYNYDEHVQVGRELEKHGRLPASYMLFPPISKNHDIWTDIARMRVLNSEQQRRNEENHVCPLQLDVCRRLIRRYTNPGETVLDPFAGIFTVPYVAIMEHRRGVGIELAPEYWRCGVGYCEQAERERTAPTLFDLVEAKAVQVA